MIISLLVGDDVFALPIQDRRPLLLRRQHKASANGEIGKSQKKEKRNGHDGKRPAHKARQTTVLWCCCEGWLFAPIVRRIPSRTLFLCIAGKIYTAEREATRRTISSALFTLNGWKDQTSVSGLRKIKMTMPSRPINRLDSMVHGYSTIVHFKTVERLILVARNLENDTKKLFQVSKHFFHLQW